MKRNAIEQALSARTISRRAMVLGGLQLGLGAVLMGRMRHLQVDQADEFLLLAEENRIKVRLVAPARGVIYDRHGRTLAGNEQIYRVSMIREDADDVEQVIANLRGLVRLDEEVLARAIKEMDRRPHQSVTLADRLSWDELSSVAINVPALPGVTPEVGLSRVYPLGPDYAHVVGYVGRVSEADIEAAEEPDPLLQTPQFQIGKIGAEARLEGVLRGRAGARRVEQNASGRIMRELGRTEGQPGAEVQLTIDAGLQNFTQARLGTESASAVVMDVRNGDVLAAVSSPSFDPNLFVEGISRPRLRRPARQRPPSAAQQDRAGALPARLDVQDGHAARRARGGGDHARRDDLLQRRAPARQPAVPLLEARRARAGGPRQVAARELRRLLLRGRAARRDRAHRRMARKLGLGIAHDVEMTSVSEGLVPDREWKRARRGEAWMVGDSFNAAIGQGFVLASPLQLAVMTARLASGLEVGPRLVRSVDGVARPSGVKGPLDLPRSWLDGARNGMYEVVNARGGTAGRSKFDLGGVKWAGKTGTSQVRNITAAERARGVTRNEDLPWRRRDHALFVGYAPYDDPRYAISVVVEHGGGGSTAAAPLARDIMLCALHGGTPPLEAYPEGQRDAVAETLAGLRLRPGLERPADATEA